MAAFTQVQRLDGSNIGIRLMDGLSFVEILTIDLLTGEAYGQFFTPEDVASIERAARSMFALIPLEERATLAFLTRLVGVSPMDDRSLTLEIDTEGFICFLRVVADALPANFLIHVPHSIGGPIAWSSGIASAGPTPPSPPVHDPRFFQAACAVDDAVGALVYAYGVTASGLPDVRTASPFDGEKCPAVGIIAAKAGATSCTVQTLGQYVFPASGTPLQVGRRYFLGDGGVVTSTPPLASDGPGRYAFIQAVGIAVTPYKLDLKLDSQTVRTNAY